MDAQILVPTEPTRKLDADAALRDAIDRHDAKSYPCDPLGLCWLCGTPMRSLGRHAQHAARCGCAIWIKHPNGTWERSNRKVLFRVQKAEADRRKIYVVHG